MNFTKQDYREFAACLRLAANRCLWDGCGDYRKTEDFVWSYSCAAAEESRDDLGLKLDIVEDFLAPLGVFVGRYTEFDEFPHGPIRQGARFLWLDFAALYAEELSL